jgi:hypothetical protein
MSNGHQPKGPPMDKPPEGWTPNPGGSGVLSPVETRLSEAREAKELPHTHAVKLYGELCSCLRPVPYLHTRGSVWVCPMCGRKWEKRSVTIVAWVSPQLSPGRAL